MATKTEINDQLDSILQGISGAARHGATSDNIEDACRSCVAYLAGWFERGQPELSAALAALLQKGGR